MLEHIFGSKTRARLLAFFFSHPATAFFTREVTRKIGGHLTAVRRELENLTKIGVLLERQSGRKKFYQVNQNSLLFVELKQLLFKAHVMVELDLLKRLQKIGNVFTIVLAGLFVSDESALTDVLIVGSVNRRKLQRFMNAVQRALDHPVRYTSMPRREFKLRFDIADRFLYSVIDGQKLVVYDRGKLLS
ncbi:MAG: hypothetical protein HYZ09_02955 [Candidatus Kerfeldbacteria bacterium]|nr:hypothetical protein [Candidatus Kerfeldbacteria bacterium]